MVEVAVGVRVKICGITRVDDGVHAKRAGADYLGVIASEGFSRSAPLELGAELGVETGLPVVAVTVNEPAARLAAIGRATRASVLQLHGDESPSVLDILRDAGEWKLWKALRVRTADEVREALDRYGEVADALLLDGWHPEHRGGSGSRFPWDLVSPFRDEFPDGTELVVAGGLTPSNVADAVRVLRPDVVDVSSGVEMEKGRKDPGRMRTFIENAKRAWQEES
ncbi:MAG TPA: phosphoribosylanthranilate isomerase [Longimicrobiales bacterium]|nr:phosphoribosylanthranilate isomerase [Longimicrobiales bacterium]